MSIIYQHARKTGGLVLLALALLLSRTSHAQLPPCVGDCDGNGMVSVDELVMVVNIALGNMDPTACPSADFNQDNKVTVDEMVMAVNAALSGCMPAPTPTPSGCSAATVPFNSTFQAIQKVVFEQGGCLNQVCHGTHTNPQGGLDLSPDVAYDNLVGVTSSQSTLKRVQVGDDAHSLLWLKLALATAPSKLPVDVTIPGAPMPSGLPPISADALEALRLWIYSGAPKTGTVPGTDTLLDACLPAPEPITIQPLDPPATGAGVQFVMPTWTLEPHSEHEICFATYYDITAQVPEAYRDPSGTMFRFFSQELRQDPFSHHLILNRYVGSADDVHDPSFGAWTCKGGEKDGQACEPTDLQSCGSGFCTSEMKSSFACIGFGPGSGLQSFYAVGGAQKAQASDTYAPGVFGQFPMKGIFYWNSHAFNLTNQNATLHARLNYYFSNDQRFPVQGIFDTSKIFSANALPYTTQNLCNNFVLPQGARLFELSSHTHKHGKHFTVNGPDGTLLYENFIYNDPVTREYDPPLLFDSADKAQRTLKYCSLYNNGVALDGSPDPVAVTRASRVPYSAQVSGFGVCSPIACAAGNIGAACNGSDDNSTCDSSPGAGDGLCDACRITGGESTENEMFILIGSYYIDNSGSGSASGGAAASRSLSTEVSVPPQVGCASSHGAHAMHAQHAGP
ncbi:MAG TPA: hypothetical protein VMW17_14860 [Candidatus Binatia bacterium]|nr:hypothetical protein [Candidatus Binatia bacterium]